MTSRKALIAALMFLVCAAVVVAGDFLPEPNISWKLNPAPISEKAGISVQTEAYSEAQLLACLEMGGDQLMRWQHLYGGWMWPEDWSTTDTHPTYTNQVGVVARALPLVDTKIPSKDYIGDGSYPGARYSAEYLKNLPLSYTPKNYYYAPDRTFMVEISEISGIPDYKTAAIAEWAWAKANVPYFNTPYAMVDYFMTNRCSSVFATWGYGLMTWDLAGYAAACEKVGDHAYAKAILDYLVTDTDYTNPPVGTSPAFWNDTARGYNKSLINNLIQRWDDNTPTSTSAEKEKAFISGAGHMIWAMNVVDPSAYAPWINELKARIIASQDINPASPTYGAYLYEKIGIPGVGIQDQGYAMMGIRNIGELASGQKATDWAIKNQETAGLPKGMWLEPDGSTYQENNSEMLQGLWEISEAEEKPWVGISVNPPGNHEDWVPVSFNVFSLDNAPCTIKVEYSINGGVTWTPTTSLSGATTGLASSQPGVEHTINWKSLPDIGFVDVDCQIRITARKDSAPDGWGSPAGVTTIFTVKNSTVPVELSIFNLN